MTVLAVRHQQHQLAICQNHQWLAALIWMMISPSRRLLKNEYKQCVKSHSLNGFFYAFFGILLGVIAGLWYI